MAATMRSASRAFLSLSGRLLIILVLVVGVPLLVWWFMGRTYTPAVEVHDEAGIVQDEALAADLQGIAFPKEVRLEVLTLDADESVNFNRAVLDYARQNEPSWISARDSNYWADGVVILAVSPSGRWVGCYLGEDVKVGYAEQEKIQQAAKSDFRLSRWAPGLERMAERASSEIGKSTRSITTAVILTALSVGGGLGWLGRMIWSARCAKRFHSDAKDRYSRVTYDYEGTELAARLIPADDAHGADVLSRFAWFESDYAKTTQMFRDFGEPSGAQWFQEGLRRDAKALRDHSTTLGALVRAIRNAAALLTMGRGWEQAWANEQGPIQEDLSAFMDLCALADSNTGLDTSPDWRWAAENQDWIAMITGGLARGEITPSAALDALDAIAVETRSRADALARRAIESSNSHTNERMRRYEKASGSRHGRRSMRYAGTWYTGGSPMSYDPTATIRLNSSSPVLLTSDGSGSAAASSFPAPLSQLVVGYSSAATWAPSSSGGGFSDSGGSSFSGGGGDFSGAGSSSSF